MSGQTTEFSFIENLKKKIKNYGNDVVAGIGDDAAVLRLSREAQLLATCDVQVEGVHFKRDFLTPQELGQRAVVVALSDIAAMGGVPRFLLLSLGIPLKTEDIFVDKLIEGVQRGCKNYRVDLVGGNLSRARELFIDCFVLGQATGKPLTRNGANVGDKVLVTGVIGNAAMARLQGKLLVPTARVKEGEIIAKSGLSTAMIDVSDGLSTDLLHICDASKVGVRIFAKSLPIQSTLKDLDLALHGGEDYELCFTAPQNYTEKIIAELKRKTGTRATIIGEILDKKEGRWVMDEDGKQKPLKAKGWDHFKKK